MDAGFSYPHRTVASDMLRDDLFGLDFSGTTLVAAGGSRVTAKSGEASAQGGVVAGDAWTMTTGLKPTSALHRIRNLDAICIDCHGDATYWHEDEGSLGLFGGVDIMLKGLP